MKINIYYGGRGVLDDPTIYVIKKMEDVLIELRVEVHHYNIYEYKNEISTLPQTLKDVDGIILATTVEWLGIGGYMNQFLDACWLYGDKEKLSSVYMQPVVISKTYGEREGLLTLENAWEILGGLPCSGLCGYVEDRGEFESNQEYAHIIEKKAENLYRTISQKAKGLPTSNQAVTQSVLRSHSMELTPQESEQLSVYASDDDYVKQQKADVIELSSMYRSMLGKQVEDEETEFISSLRSHYQPVDDMNGRFLFDIEGKPKPLFVEVNGDDIICHYGNEDVYDVYLKIPYQVMNNIVAGRESFYRAFTVGDLTAKGVMKLLQGLDKIFPFMK